MFTTWDKAISAFLTSIVSMLVLTGAISMDAGINYQLLVEIVAGGIATGAATWLLPNKPKPPT